MLSVHNYYQPFAPVPRSHAPPTRRHKEVITERGRSRDVSKAALARKKSEERRKRAAIAEQLAEQARASSSRATSPPAVKPHNSSIPNDVPAEVEDAGSVASSSSCRLPSPPRRPVLTSEQPVYVTDSTTGASDSCRPHRVTEPYSCSVTEASSLFGEDEESSTSVDGLSLEDQMQQAYAACQTTCLPTPGRNHCRCRNMHRARVLYLKTQGIDVTSDNDPRIDQVLDEDFVFVPGGELVLDEESLAAINEERERREKELEARRCHARSQALESIRAKTARRCDRELRSNMHTSYQLEIRANRGRPLRTGASGLSRQCTDPNQWGKPEIIIISAFRPIMAESKPRSVSFNDITRSLHGPLFPESEPRISRSPSQDQLLNSLLEPVGTQNRTGRRANNKGRTELDLRAWTISRSYPVPEVDSSCIACSVSSDSTISRTNSWASTTSAGTSSTSITSPPSSPRSGKLHLPLVDDNLLREQIIHSCRSHRRSKLTVVALAETPLHVEGGRQEQNMAESILPISRECKDENVASVLVSRVRQSVFGLVDFASRMQQSYLRTIQFATTLQPVISSFPSPSPTPKPSGYRASASDVLRFAPHPVSGPTRDLNLPSDLNIPLVSTRPDSDAAVTPRVFAPLAFVPPSPLRPRKAPLTPEWRLRPVANPCTLRLKAHANCLNEKGIPWEGRAHTGSLGCGRERLTGVAFEGLGGSRLAFEAK